MRIIDYFIINEKNFHFLFKIMFPRKNDWPEKLSFAPATPPTEKTCSPYPSARPEVQQLFSPHLLVFACTTAVLGLC